MTTNEKEIELLRTNPYSLILEYQDIIDIIVNKFIRSGGIHFSEKNEFIQIIYERLLLSSEKIKKQYKGISLLKTYLSTIIRNICLEEINKKNRQYFSEIYESKQLDSLENNINEEFDRLSKIFNMFNKNTSKLVLCFKIMFRLPILVSDITNYYPKFNNNEINILIEAVNPKKMIPEFELFQILAPYINKCKKKNIQPDTLRRWTKRKIDEIIELINGDPPRANYDKETIQILIEKYFSN